MPSKRQKSPQSLSGAVGGPATGAGIRYQIDFAILQSLEMISRALVNPFEQGEFSMEPRIVSGKDVTCWDVQTSPPDTVTEAKLRPKRDEVVEWLDRVERGMTQSSERRFQLFYGRGAGPLLSAVERLCRIAIEAGGTAEQFGRLVGVETTAELDVVLDHLRTNPHCSLLRVRLVPFDPATLERDIQLYLRLLVREPHRQPLYDFLFSRFHKGIEQRLTSRVRDLVTEANTAGIEFSRPRTFEAQQLEPVVRGTIFVLQSCELGLPAEILAPGLDCTEQELNSSLAAHVAHGVLIHDDNMWAVAPFKPAFVQDNGPVLLERIVRQLLEFTKTNKKNALGWRQVPNAIALAKLCQSDYPDLVASLFWKLDKLLKRIGNKRLVLEVANLSIAAARRANRTEDQAKGEAVALICGRSWVYQRINRLAEARAEAEKSMNLGNEIEWDRNTAYCLKCIGRLFRMEAEQNKTNMPKYQALLQSSIDYLQQAIEKFPHVSELSSVERGTEVGDCYSLLGRTYLVGGDRRKAEKAAREAFNRITDRTLKDYADLQILFGDLASAERDKDAADSYYDEAIRVAGDADAERSEIAARAWFQKGLLIRASHCFDNAAKIWEQLQEDENADKAKWESMLLTGGTPSSARDVLANESASVRVEVIRLHDRRLAGMTEGNRGRRSELDRTYWVGLLPDAKRNVAVHRREW
jgi:tetratricopeptide (TPR) repeat protein